MKVKIKIGEGNSAMKPLRSIKYPLTGKVQEKPLWDKDSTFYSNQLSTDIKVKLSPLVEAD